MVCKSSRSDLPALLAPSPDNAGSQCEQATQDGGINRQVQLGIIEGHEADSIQDTPSKILPAPIRL